MQPPTGDIPEMLDGHSRVTIAAIGELWKSLRMNNSYAQLHR